MGGKIQPLRIVTCEIVVPRGDFPSGNTNALVNVVGYVNPTDDRLLALKLVAL